MKSENVILIEECCSYYSIETSFVHTLNEYGLIELEQKNTAWFIHHDQLAQLEKYMHLHYDLDINVEGIEAINHLLEKIEQLQEEIRTMKTL